MPPQGSVTLTGTDTLQIDDRIIADHADGDYGKLEYPEDIATVKRSKNGNTVYGFNESGYTCELTLRVLVASADDKWLTSRLTEQKNDPAAFILLNGTVNKRVGDGKGGTSTKVYQCSGGVFKKQPGSTSNAEGSVEQSVSVWTIKFGNGDPSVQ